MTIPEFLSFLVPLIITDSEMDELETMLGINS